MTVYTCSPDLASILTCIYEAWNSRLGYRNVRLMTEPVGNLSCSAITAMLSRTQKPPASRDPFNRRSSLAARLSLCNVREKRRSRHHLSFSALRLFLWKGYPAYAAGTGGIPRF